jgi:hypothetical protein
MILSSDFVLAGHMHMEKNTELLNYISEMAGCLSKMARKGGFETLAFLLEMSALEARPTKAALIDEWLSVGDK